MKKEYVFVGLIGLYILTYVLDAVVDPFQLQRATPYHYLTIDILMKYPFTMVSIFLKAFLLFLSPLWLFLSSIKLWRQINGVSSGIYFCNCMQYNKLQLRCHLPLEWTLALAYGGALLLIPTLGYFIMGITGVKAKVAPKRDASTTSTTRRNTAVSE
jgi:hypothetical protein